VPKRPHLNTKPVPPELVERLIEAGKVIEKAKQQCTAAIIDCLTAGASFQQVADVIGLSREMVRRIAKEAGWPPPSVVKRREAERAQRNAWRETAQLVQENWPPKQ
jgi:cell division septum initiation protein DivIVA